MDVVSADRATLVFSPEFEAGAVARSQEMAVKLDAVLCLPLIDRQEPPTEWHALKPPNPDVVRLGAVCVIWLANWELNGIRKHVEAGLPSAKATCGEFLRRFFQPELEDFVHTICATILRVYHDSFLWHRQACSLHVDLAISMGDDVDELLDALADFLADQCQKE